MKDLEASILVAISKDDFNTYTHEEINKIKESDVVIFALGEHFRESGEAHSKAHIRLSDKQMNLYQEIKKMSKKQSRLLLLGDLLS